ncbi:hypothetical protein DEO72_LG10g918 [Vigna unguiculata]|uniref:Uncharacterized protein n=1 Tax=Vigna unguiculata TaxID=3917 RepID=A0A4D6N7H1_VIGUN|nr:hypothetical protein DEO72_LG10g918 [Vigna unguiculata]
MLETIKTQQLSPLLSRTERSARVCPKVHFELTPNLVPTPRREALAHSHVSFLSCHATVVLRLCGWCDVVIAVNVEYPWFGLTWRASISPRREGSRLSEIPRWFLLPFSSPRLGEGDSPERERLA